MTTTNGHKADPLSVLTRADQRWCRDRMDDPGDPEYLRVLAAAVEPLLSTTTPSTPATAPPRAAAPDVSRVAELEAARAELTRAAGRLRADYQAVKADVDAARAETERVRAQLADAKHHAHLWESEYRRVAADRAEERDLALKAAEVEAAHHCAWPWDDPTRPPGPCECGRPFPRTHVFGEDTELVEPDPDPWGQVWERVRADLAGWGSSGKRRKRAG